MVMRLKSTSLTMMVRDNIVSCSQSGLIFISPELTVKLATLHQIHDEDKGPAQVCAVLDNGCFPSESFEIHMRTLVDSAGI